MYTLMIACLLQLCSICCGLLARRSESDSHVHFTDVLCSRQDLAIKPPSGGRIFIWDVLILPRCGILSSSEQMIISVGIPRWLDSCQLARECILSNSSSSHTEGSFAVRYTVIPERGLGTDPVFNVCDTEPIAQVKAGYIRSPNYPNTYPNNLKCQKVIVVPPKHRLLLYADDFELEGKGIIGLFTGKPNDYVQINNGRLLSGDLTGKVLSDWDTEVTEANATVFFKTDHANTWRSYRGFSIHFFIVPPGNSHWHDKFDEWTRKEEGLALHSLHSLSTDVSEARGHKHNLIVLLVSICAVSLFLIVFVYIKHWRMARTVKRSLREAVEEVVGYVSTGEGWKPTGHGGSPSAATALLADRSVEKGVSVDRPAYEYVINVSGAASDFGGNGTAAMTKLIDPPPSYEDVHAEKKEKK